MLLVEDVARLRQIDDLVGPLRPRQRDDPIEIGPRHRVFGGRGWHLREPIELAQRLFLDRVRHARGFDLRAELLDLLGLIVALAELALNRLELLAQEVVALVLADLRLHLRLDLRAELEHFELLDQEPIQQIETLADVERLEHFLPRLGRDGTQTRGDEVSQAARFANVGGQRLQVVRHQRRDRHDLLKVGLDVPLQGVDFEPVAILEDLDGFFDLGAEIRPHVHELAQPDPRESLDDDPEAAVRQLEHLVNVAGRPDRIEVVAQRLVFARLALREDRNQAAARNRLVNQPHRALARHRERHERIGKQHRIAQRQHRQLGWQPECRRVGRRALLDRDVSPSPLSCPVRCSSNPSTLPDPIVLQQAAWMVMRVCARPPNPMVGASPQAVRTLQETRESGN